MNKDMNCPICDKAVRSDASVRRFCKLCGMGLPDTGDRPEYEAEDGNTFFFCCEKCKTTYQTNIVDGGEEDGNRPDMRNEG